MLEDGNVKALYRFAKACTNLGDVQEALVLLERAQKMDSDNQ